MAQSDAVVEREVDSLVRLGEECRGALAIKAAAERLADAKDGDDESADLLLQQQRWRPYGCAGGVLGAGGPAHA